MATPGPRRRVAVAVAVLLCLAAAAAENATHATTPSFLDCVGQGQGRATLLAAGPEQADALLGRVLGCARRPLLRGLRAVRRGDLALWDGAVALHRVADDDAVAEPAGRALTEDDLASTHDVIVELDRASRAFAMDVELYPGVKASLRRDARSDDAVNLSFKLDPRAVQDDEEDDEEEEEEEPQHQEEQQDEPADADQDRENELNRQAHKKKKKLKGLKKLKKKLAPYLPLLAIPLAIQLFMLPLYILALKVMALKSILLGKMTLLLVAFNVLRNAQQRQHEDDHNSRVAAEYYGYHDDGIEYGGWVNRRRAFTGRASPGSSSRASRSEPSQRRR